MKNEYGEDMYELEDGRKVPYYIHHLLTYGDSVIPRRTDLNERFIYKKYGLKVTIGYSDMDYFTSKSKLPPIRIARLVK